MNGRGPFHAGSLIRAGKMYWSKRQKRDKCIFYTALQSGSENFIEVVKFDTAENDENEQKTVYLNIYSTYQYYMCCNVIHYHKNDKKAPEQIIWPKAYMH